MSDILEKNAGFKWLRNLNKRDGTARNFVLLRKVIRLSNRLVAAEKERDSWKAKAEANERDARYASSAADDVLNERERQINVEGWDESHDDEHDDESLALAAVCYAFPPNDLQINDELGIPVYWPDSWAYAHWKPKDRRRDLVRAAALIIAEIERLDRAAFSAEKKKE